MSLVASGHTLKVVFFLLLLLLKTPVHAITISKETRWTLPSSFKITANLTGNDKLYGLFIGTVRTVSFEIPGIGERNKCPRLPKQVNGRAPPCWFTVDLPGRGDQRIEIALRTDNMYLVGFKNKLGKWFELQPKKGQDQLIPGATLLTFGGSYRDLLGPGGHRNLYSVSFGKGPFLDSIETLNNYPSNTISEEQLKKALVVLIVMVCEAARMDPIKNKINSGWDYGTILDNTQIPYIVNWGKMCFYVLCDAYGSKWTNKDFNDLKAIKVDNLVTAKSIVSIYLWPANFDPHNVDVACTKSCNNS